MDLRSRLHRYREEVLRELKEDILEFWLAKVMDFPSGGFHGVVDSEGRPQSGADKGVILATRMLWTFSRAYARLKDERCLRAAALMNSYLEEHFLDKEHGGVFWMLNSQGKPTDSQKKFYAQAFAIYAFAEYARAASDGRAMDQARALFKLTEAHGRDRALGGYLDALSRDWKPMADTRLSDKDLSTPKTMNTNLHVMEAYAGLLHAAPDPAVSEALGRLVQDFLKHILLPNGHLGLFFEMDWKEVSGKVSFGHDIEGSWLLVEAAKAAGQAGLVEQVGPTATRMARVFVEEALEEDGGVKSEREADRTLHAGKEWWMQPEAMVGLLDAYQRTGEAAFAEASLLAWDYSKRHYLRPGGEWHSNLDAKGQPLPGLVLAGPWKCPYHTGRACLEIAERVEALG